jgi:hypothetical protein
MRDVAERVRATYLIYHGQPTRRYRHPVRASETSDRHSNDVFVHSNVCSFTGAIVPPRVTRSLQANAERPS